MRSGSKYPAVSLRWAPGPGPYPTTITASSAASVLTHVPEIGRPWPRGQRGAQTRPPTPCWKESRQARPGPQRTPVITCPVAQRSKSGAVAKTRAAGQPPPERELPAGPACSPEPRRPAPALRLLARTAAAATAPPSGPRGLAGTPPTEPQLSRSAGIG